MTLIPIGPLTNIGLLFALDPEIPALLKRWVLMGGRFVDGPPGGLEWNAMLDPHATAIAFAANAPGTRAIGLDVTMRCTMPAEECRKRFNPIELILSEVSPVVGSHVGPGTVSIAYQAGEMN